MADAMRCRRPESSVASAMPRSARLIASVPPAGQHELGRGCPDEGCDGLAGLIKPRFGPLAEGVDRRRVARLVGEHTADGIGHTRSHGRGGVVIEINPHGVVSS
jgi:hypothetical protein